LKSSTVRVGKVGAVGAPFEVHEGALTVKIATVTGDPGKPGGVLAKTQGGVQGAAKDQYLSAGGLGKRLILIKLSFHIKLNILYNILTNFVFIYIYHFIIFSHGENCL
jgi:hypothetical protein